MNKFQLKQIIKEQIRHILSESDTYLADEIYNNDYTTITISLKYANEAQRIFNDSIRKKSIQTYSDTYEFTNSEDAANFVITLVNSGIPEEEIELS